MLTANYLRVKLEPPPPTPCLAVRAPSRLKSEIGQCCFLLELAPPPERPWNARHPIIAAIFTHAAAAHSDCFLFTLSISHFMFPLLQRALSGGSGQPARTHWSPGRLLAALEDRQKFVLKNLPIPWTVFTITFNPKLRNKTCNMDLARG